MDVNDGVYNGGRQNACGIHYRNLAHNYSFYIGGPVDVQY